MNEIYIHALVEFVIAPMALLKVYLTTKENRILRKKLGK